MGTAEHDKFPDRKFIHKVSLIENLSSVAPETAEQFNGREGETAALFGRCPLPLACSYPVSPHVISAVRRFFEKAKWKC